MSLTIRQHMELSGLPYCVTTAIPFVLSGGEFAAVAVHEYGNTKTTVWAGFYPEREGAKTAALAAGQRQGVRSYVLQVEQIK